MTVETGIGFQAAGTELSDVDTIKDSPQAVSITIDGHAVREPPGPSGLPFVG